MRKNPRCLAKYMITLALRFKFPLPVLPVSEVKLVFFVFVKIDLLRGLMYRFIVDNRGVQIIDKAGGVRWRIGEADSKRRVTSASSDNILAKMYSAMISRITPRCMVSSSVQSLRTHSVC